ncbi:hypothetical protein Glove_89g46 [Diversispora epigaea]|uniref:Uncharacterized protein n=1 Tax=Diversispora epigaea TaxID=1348612 RepID=A0A397JEK3_9GLOM|nr:hypothetical protein Glove_89g46 [Diversispora epigaea]
MLSEGTYQLTIILPTIRASLKNLPIGDSFFISTSEKQSVASANRKGDGFMGRRPDIMFNIEKQFLNLCVQIAGNELHLNLLVRDIRNVHRYYHLRSVEIPVQFSDERVVYKFVETLLLLRNLIITNLSLLYHGQASEYETKKDNSIISNSNNDNDNNRTAISLCKGPRIPFFYNLFFSNSIKRFVMNIQQREVYFKKTDPSQWSLISFLRWRSQFSDFSSASIEHSAWKKLLEDISNNVRDSASQRAKKLALSFKNDKKSKVIQEFWKEHKLGSITKETQLQMAVSDLKYVVKKSEEATIHSDLIGKRRYRILENGIKEPSPEIYESSESPTINDELNETADEKDEDSSSDNDDSECTSDIEDQNPPPLLPQLDDFHKFFAKMNKDQKWVLKSGKYVEDTIFEYCKKLSIETYLHSWIIDLDDQEAERLFTTEEWDEIKNEAHKLPKVDKTFAESMMRFSEVKTTSEFRKVLKTTSFLDENEPYSREKYYDVEWAEIVMKKFLIYYEDPNEPLKKLHLESWYDINVWSHIIDHGLSNINGMEIVRKESSSEAVSTRKNRKRAGTRHKKVSRKKVGYKMDGIFRTYTNDVEYGVTEVGKKFDSTKLLKDGFKIGKAMHDIFVSLCKLVHFEEKKIRQLRIAGMLHLGLKSQVLQLSSPKGYVVILKRDKLLEVPVTVDNIKNLIMVLASVWKVKKMIMDCMEIVNTSIQDSTDFLQEIIGTETPPPEIDIPWSLDSIV